MKWAKMQEPLWRGMQVFRESWPDDQYIMREDNITLIFSDQEPDGRPAATLDLEELDADDWMATGPAGD